MNYVIQDQAQVYHYVVYDQMLNLLQITNHLRILKFKEVFLQQQNQDDLVTVVMHKMQTMHRQVRIHHLRVINGKIIWMLILSKNLQPMDLLLLLYHLETLNHQFQLEPLKTMFLVEYLVQLNSVELLGWAH